MLMSRVVLFGVFFLGSATLLNAAPLDSPDTVYVDGTPCNSACQSYLAWSRQILSGRQPQIPPPDVAQQRAARTVAARPRTAPNDRAAKQASSDAGRTKREKIARLQQRNRGDVPVPVRKPADTASRAAPAAAALTPSNPTPDTPNALNPNDVNPNDVNPNAVNKPAEQTAGLQQPPSSTGAIDAPGSPKIETANTETITDTRKTETPKTTPKTMAVQDQVIAATALAEQLTSSAAARPELRAMNREADHADHNGAKVPTDAHLAAAPIVSDASVALVMSSREINSVAELARKNVAMDSRRSGSANDVRNALVAAGAGEVQLSTSETRAVDRLVRGEVPAAVLTLVSPDAAEAFPEIAGFRVFRIPLSPGAVQARPDRP
jgi:hypothetical protein